MSRRGRTLHFLKPSVRGEKNENARQSLDLCVDKKSTERRAGRRLKRKRGKKEVPDNPHELQEGFVHIVAVLGRSLHVVDPVFSGKGLSVLPGDLRTKRGDGRWNERLRDDTKVHKCFLGGDNNDPRLTFRL